MYEFNGPSSAEATVRAILDSIGGSASGRLQAFVTGLPVSGDTLGRVQFGATINHDTGDARIGGAIVAKASADWTPDSCPTVLILNVCPPGSTVAVEVGRIDHLGNLTIKGHLSQAA